MVAVYPLPLRPGDSYAPRGAKAKGVTDTGGNGEAATPGRSHALDFSPSISQSDRLNRRFHSTSLGGSTDVNEPMQAGRESYVAERRRARHSHG